jgi:hypothetical protein
VAEAAAALVKGAGTLVPTLAGILKLSDQLTEVFFGNSHVRHLVFDPLANEIREKGAQHARSTNRVSLTKGFQRG